MTVNIPTDLLRTLVAVVDLRSFTRAAQSLGITQPAVSAQIKRLQFLLGTELLDKSAPGVTLTSDGEMVVKYVRQLLAINDHILDLAAPRQSHQTLRIGMAGDSPAGQISVAIARFRAAQPDVSFEMACSTIDRLLRDMRENDLDVVVGFSATTTDHELRHQWQEELVWVGSQPGVESREVLPIVTYGEACIFHRAAITAAKQAQREYHLAYIGPSIFGIASAVAAGVGLTVLPRRTVANFPSLSICVDPRLPPLPEVIYGIFVREGAGREIREQIADAIADALAPDRGERPVDGTALGEPAAASRLHSV